LCVECRCAGLNEDEDRDAVMAFELVPAVSWVGLEMWRMIFADLQVVVLNGEMGSAVVVHSERAGSQLWCFQTWIAVSAH
jgi:hypothetical protein